MFTRFFNKLSLIIDKHIPVRQITKKELKFHSKPWITTGLKNSIKVKNKLYRKYLITKSTYYHCKFKNYRNRLNHLLKISKRSYYNNYFLQNTKDSKRIWNGIKKIVHFRSKNNHNINKIIENDTVMTDSKEIANAFNKYFSTIGVNLADKIENVDKSPMDYLKTPIPTSFYVFPVEAPEIEREISCLKDNKSTGPFSAPIKVLKSIKKVISHPLEMLFNMSFSLGIVPSSLKISNVIPIYKKDSQYSLSNYRPISLLSVFDKLLEKLMANRLVTFLEKNNLLFGNQFGFRSNHSTDYALLSIIDKIQTAIADDSDYSCGIFLDFSKAFDTVDHNILIKKLDYYGIRGTAKNWFISYLSNRQQSVTINNSKSDPVTISCGIPQGSVLGPILFLIYINDFHLCSTLFDFNLFADDANLFYRHKNLHVLQQNINSELINIHVWLCANKLSLNIEKSNFVLFHARQKKITINFELKLNNKNLKQEESLKYLGIFIDSNLSWKPHIKYISKKIKRNVGVLSKLRYYVDTDILVNLYYALVYPYLIYGILTWGNTYATTLQPIFILQKKVVRLITFSAFDAHSSPLFKRLNIMKLHDLVDYCTAVFMYKFKNNILPIIFDRFFTSVKQIHSYSTRSATKDHFYMPKIRTNYGKFNIRFTGSLIWNSFDDSVKLKKFKCNIINFLSCNEFRLVGYK